jgi:hypothetical protein
MGPSGSEPRPVAGTLEEYSLLCKFHTLELFSISSVTLFKVYMLTTRRKTLSNIVSVVVLYLKSERRRRKENRKQESKNKSPYSMQHLLPNIPATNRKYSSY